MHQTERNIMKGIAPVIGRLLIVVVVVATWLAVSRLIVLSLLVNKPYGGWCDPSYDYSSYYSTSSSECIPEPSYFDIGPAAAGGEWVAGHALGFLALLVTAVVCVLLAALVSWIIFGGSNEPQCRAKDCKCVCHKDENYDSSSSAWIATTAATTAATAAIIAST